MRILRKIVKLMMVLCMLMMSINFIQPLHASELKGSTHAEQLYNYFYDRGYTPQAAAAIVGNVMWESCGGYGYLNFPLHTVEAATGEGIGMCQWSFERKYNFIAYCKSRGTTWQKSTLDVQADFLEKELKSGEHWLFPSYLYSSNITPYKMSYKQFKNQTNLEKAVGGFCFNFERPSEYYARFSKRIEYAKKVLKKYQKKHTAPKNIEVNVNKDDLNISWKKGTATNKSVIEIYNKDWKKITTYTTTNETYTKKNLDKGIYYIRIGAKTPRNEIKYSDYDAIVIGNTSLAKKVMATNIKTKVIDYQTLQVKWDEVDNVSEYVVYRKVNNGSYQKYKTLTTNSFKMKADTGLKYSFKIKTWIKNKKGMIEGPMSETVVGKTALTDKIDLQISRKSNTTFQLKWNEVEGATQYNIYMKSSQGSYQKIKVVDADVLQYTTSVLTPDVYTFALKAARYDHSKYVYSSLSNKVRGKSVFQKTTVTLTKKSDTSIQINWKKVDGMPYYSVYRKINNGSYQKIHSSDTTKYIDKNLKKDKTYSYQVKGYRIVNGRKYYSPASNEISLSL